MCHTWRHSKSQRKKWCWELCSSPHQVAVLLVSIGPFSPQYIYLVQIFCKECELFHSFFPLLFCIMSFCILSVLICCGSRVWTTFSFLGCVVRFKVRGKKMIQLTHLSNSYVLWFIKASCTVMIQGLILRDHCHTMNRQRHGFRCSDGSFRARSHSEVMEICSDLQSQTLTKPSGVRGKQVKTEVKATNVWVGRAGRVVDWSNKHRLSPVRAVFVSVKTLKPNPGLFP